MTAGVIIGRRVPGVGTGGVIRRGMTVGAGMAGGMRIVRGVTEVAHRMEKIAVAGSVDCMIVAGLGVVAGTVGRRPIVRGMVGIGGGVLVIRCLARGNPAQDGDDDREVEEASKVKLRFHSGCEIQTLPLKAHSIGSENNWDGFRSRRPPFAGTTATVSHLHGLNTESACDRYRRYAGAGSRRSNDRGWI